MPRLRAAMMPGILSARSATVFVQFLLIVVSRERIHEGLQLAIHGLFQLMDGQPDTMIGHAVLREIVSADLLATVTGADLGLTLFRHRRGLPLLLDFVQTRAQHAHTFFAVLDLRLLVLAADDCPSRNVRDADGGVSRVDRLPART